jgi:hypothetical protein
MKRWILLAGLVVMLTTAATVAVQFLPEESPAPGGVELPAPSADAGPHSKAEVQGDLTYRFDTAPQHTTLRKDWVIQNTGEGDLQIKKGPPACSCTITNFEGDKDTLIVKPHETATIHLSFETRDYNGRYHKSATVLTNDPQHQSIEFAADGEIHPAVAVYPDPTVNFLEISNDDPDHRAGVAVFSADKPDLKITKLESSRPGVVVVDQAPLTEEDCKKLKVKAGYRINLDVKLGMPLGSFREEVVIGTDHPKQPEIRLTLLGRVVGPITVAPERLWLHNVSSSQGAERELKVVVRRRRATKFEVVRKPEKLKIEVVLNDEGDKTGVYRLVVTVPPGTAPGSVEDLIVLKTDHPLASEVKIPVNIFIRDAG